MTPLRLLAIIEASTVTGPAKNLIEFHRTIRPWNAVELSVATFVRTDRPNPFTEAIEAEGIPLIRIRERRAFDPAVLPQIRSAAASADIVQTHAVKSHFLLYLSRVWRTHPWIAFHHGYTTTDRKMLVYNQLDRLSLRRAPARLVTVSLAFERQLVERGVDPSRITVLHNAVDPGWAEQVRSMDRATARRQLGIANAGRVLICIGRMSSEKGHTDLIAAYAEIRHRIPAAQLLLIGDGPERARLEAVAGDGVVFTGQVRDTSLYYAAADAMVLPSLTEGSPNVLLEAMATGVPVVATAVGGTPEIATDGVSALLVPPHDPHRLAAAIGQILGDDDLRAALVSKARAVIEQKHMPAQRARVLVDMYRETV